MSTLPAISLNVNYEEITAGISDFLQNFKSSLADIDMGLDNLNLSAEAEKSLFGPKYMRILQQVADRKVSTIYIELDDLRQFESEIGSRLNLVDKICDNAYRYVELFSRCVDELMPEPTEDITYKDDVIDVILHQRKLRNKRIEEDHREELNAFRYGMSVTDQEGNPTGPAPGTAEDEFPALLTRRYCLYFKPTTDLFRGNGKALAVRQVKGEHLGHLITIRGIVTRVSDVKPAVAVSAYTCDKCGYEIFQEVNARTFTPLSDCPSEQCRSNQTKGKLFMSTRASKFSPFQEVKIQEMADQVPIGHIPRTLSIHVNGNLVRSMNPGDIVDVTGIFLPSPYTGFKALKAGLLTETYLEAQYVHQDKKKYDDESAEMSQETLDRINQLRAQGNVYERLAKSIAPEIYGQDDVKKALLLLLVGGVSKEMGDGMKIRGDINICLMGDPGVAKSQLMKSISKIAPRGVYTTGKGSSGVGLTAAVMRDPITDEMVLEGGALVLADNGICCIDEFDKMDDTDRTAIHEVMEQQTISISKAGITTTLNARTSILAAANPVYGRYNPRLSPVENINLPAALLSRFDILFLMLDTPTREDDERLAAHVAYVHMHNRHPEAEFESLDSMTIRQFVSLARTYRPVLPKDVGDYITNSYIKMRQEQKRNEGSRHSFGNVTPRTLLGILRLSQALARLRFADKVSFEDVDEALRLVQVSKTSLERTRNDPNDQDQSATSKIHRLIRDLAQNAATGKMKSSLSMKMIKQRAIARGFTEQQINEAINEYAMLGIWQVIDEGKKLSFINVDDENMISDDDDDDEEMAEEGAGSSLM